MNIRLILQLSATLMVAVLAFILPAAAGWHGLPYVIIGVFAVGCILLVHWHSAHTAYQCSSCRHTFIISAWTDFMSPHKGGEKLLRCGRCGYTGWLEETDRGQVLQTESTSPPTEMIPVRSANILYLQIFIVVALYVALWIASVAVTDKDISAGSRTFDLLLVTSLLPLLHFAYCHFAARNGYRSRIYPIITAITAVFLLFVTLMQLR
ncbi:MAG: hypothetical protein GY841_15000 [FCB group bacterium]|nr:hypothetical protein [FCB group bacterium]